MRLIIAALVWPAAIAAIAAPAPAPKTAPAAPSPKEAEHRREDIARHRQMARAHEEAAHCLESGQPEKACQERLREMCKGIGVGQYCGMRHGH